jgi:60 kDa SS-A/Ro ribonucleoprotein
LQVDAKALSVMPDRVSRPKQTWFSSRDGGAIRRISLAIIIRKTNGEKQVESRLSNPTTPPFAIPGDSAARTQDRKTHKEIPVNYSKILNLLKTPQSQPIPFSNQIPNAAGGYAWNVDKWTKLDRFLVLGSEKGTYYIGEHKLTMEHAENLIEALVEDGKRVVKRIVAISHAGRAVKNDPAIFALALAASLGDQPTKTAAFEALPSVCRTATHLFAFVETCEGLRGWGRGMRKAVGRWYNAQSPEALAYALVKYQARGGWTNRDLLRLAHPKPATEQHGVLYKWVVDDELVGEAPMVQAVLDLGKAANVAEAARTIREYRVPREAVPTELLTRAEVWEALLSDMPLTAMIRNLGNLSKCGLLTVGSPAAGKVAKELKSVDRLRKARIHPISLLSALVTYASGQSVRGSGSWVPVPTVVDALNDAFYAAFANARKTRLRYVLGLDVSGSMNGTRVAGIAGLDCRKACGAMALVTAAVEDEVTSLAFDTKVYPLAISARQRLDDVVHTLARTGGGGTDCAAPIRYAIENRIKADAFVIYTDSETWQGKLHPAQAIAEYRKATGIRAKLVVVAMASNRSTIGDPGDAGTLNVVGFDTTVPQVVAEFLRA